MKHWEYTQYVSKEDYLSFKERGTTLTPGTDIPCNTAVYIACDEPGCKRLEGVYDPQVKGVRPLKDKTAPNRDLRLYIDALMSPHITVIAVDGLMGTGKTSTCIKFLCSHVVPKEVPVNPENGSVISRSPNQHQVLIAKPYVSAGDEDYGFLPGDLNEKIDPTIRNFTQYFDRFTKSGFHTLRAGDYIGVLPLGFIRGIDAKNMTIIVDEAQNTKELVSVVTRKAQNSRVVLLGDTSKFQIDNKNNTPEHNGLVHITGLLEGAYYFQKIELKTVEHVLRSKEVADLVKRLLKE